MLKIKRIYELPAKNDGMRILVDGIWPRGVSKERARIDLWLKEIAPSRELRQWFGHDIQKWEQFKERYALELETKENSLLQIAGPAREGTVTLLYAAKAEECNNALALKQFLEERPGG